MGERNGNVWKMSTMVLATAALSFWVGWGIKFLSDRQEFLRLHETDATLVKADDELAKAVSDIRDNIRDIKESVARIDERTKK